MKSLLFAAAVWVVSSSVAGFELNDTGMSVCIDDLGSPISCANTGQDGALGRDVDHPQEGNGHAGFSFKRMCNSGELAGTGSCPVRPTIGLEPDEWGCTYDQVTRLVWEVKVPDGGVRDPARLLTPKQADQQASRYNTNRLCGRTDWRRPSRLEAQSIIWYGNAHLPFNDSLAVDQSWLPNVTGAWTSESWGPGVWFQSYFREDVQLNDPQAVASSQLVSGGLSERAVRYHMEGDQVLDRWTGLVWERCVEGQVWTGATCQGSGSPYTWSSALERARAKALETGVAWRVPSIKEALSIIEPDFKNPALDPKAFPNSPSYIELTATPFWDRYAMTTREVWVVMLGAGAGRPTPIGSGGLFLRLVH